MVIRTHCLTMFNIKPDWGGPRLGVASPTNSAGIRAEGGALDASASRSTGAGLVPETSPDFQKVIGR